ncbi:hypothetical protein L3Y34_012902 [Caenorhabditis briggsae]|uniref:Uncharacterized protein n=1 Tax=Caenorhabditis briggsae TaxID=6238 RepID=A0AAE9CW26_CAEBR|nr:hypothetical protein L3Y34_012902 [Caenorhabditis briggsae]
MFEGQNPEIEFEITNDGTRLENICKITVNAITYKYKIKANHGAGGNNKASRWDLDIIELYCFKLLESIGVGPKTVIIPKCGASEPLFYIGNELLADFHQLD